MEQPLPDDLGYPFPRDDQARAGGVNHRLWTHRVITWDIPVFTLLVVVPAVVEAVFPNGDAVGLVAGVLPPCAFFLRAYAGKRQLAQNQVPLWLRVIQTVVFFTAIAGMLFIDALMLAMQGVAPDVALFFGLVGLVVYMASMAIAMYPGRTAIAE